MVGVVLVGLAVWMAVGPWTVHFYGQTYGCGSPFMGRYTGSHGDPGAQASFAWLQQAANRRTVALVSGSTGGILIVRLVFAFGSRSRRSSLSDSVGT